MKICCSCKFPKLLDDFGYNKNKKDGRQSYCKECGRERDKKCYHLNSLRRHKIREAAKAGRKRNQEWAIHYLSIHPCVDCGESEILYLDFDHVRGYKKTDICKMIFSGYTIEKIEEEVKKCEVRCVKCHRRKTAEQFGWYKFAGIG